MGNEERLLETVNKEGAATLNAGPLLMSCTSAACSAASLKRGLFSSLNFNNFWWSSCWLADEADEGAFVARGLPSPAAAAVAALSDWRFLAENVEAEEANVDGERDRARDVTEEMLLLLLLLLLRRVCRGMDAWRVG